MNMFGIVFVQYLQNYKLLCMVGGSVSTPTVGLICLPHVGLLCDSKWIYFTSDRGGRPQIYKVSAAGGKPSRITREGDYNARASISPDGTRIAVAHGRGNEYRIAVLDMDTGRINILTPGVLDESPSFAPNGSMILYATKEGQKGVLSAVSVDGNVRQRLILADGDVREPAWSPVIR